MPMNSQLSVNRPLATRKPRTIFLSMVLSGLIICDLAGADISFERDVAPILVKRCIECHDAKQKKGGLDLTSFKALSQGGDSGEIVKHGDASATVSYTHLTLPTIYSV